MVGGCTLTAVIVLYRNLALLTSINAEDLKLGVLHTTTFFNIGVLVLGVIFSILVSLDILSVSENGEKLLAVVVISCIILFSGIISPKLPYNKHTGLRLPWTVQDEDTWNAAHRIIGYISVPLVLLYLAAIFTINNVEVVSLVVMLLWIGIPGLISFAFWWKKYHGKL